MENWKIFECRDEYLNRNAELNKFCSKVNWLTRRKEEKKRGFFSVQLFLCLEHFLLYYFTDFVFSSPIVVLKSLYLSCWRFKDHPITVIWILICNIVPPYWNLFSNPKILNCFQFTIDNREIPCSKFPCKLLD